MNQGQTIFSQVIDFLPKKIFRQCVNRYNGNHRVCSFTCYNQFLCMAFAQLAYRESLRDIECCLRAMREKLYHIGIRGKVSRTYIDLNMVRTGAVKHPSEWAFCGYNEIQKPKRKNVLINYEKLTELLGFDSYDVKKYHKRLVEDFLENGKNTRDDKWTKSIAVGNKSFVEKVKSLMRVLAIGRKSTGVGESYELREPEHPIGLILGSKRAISDLKIPTFGT